MPDLGQRFQQCFPTEPNGAEHPVVTESVDARSVHLNGYNTLWIADQETLELYEGEGFQTGAAPTWPYDYRHWREFLLEEAGCLPDAHVFDLSNETVGMLYQLNRIWMSTSVAPDRGYRVGRCGIYETVWETLAASWPTKTRAGVATVSGVFDDVLPWMVRTETSEQRQTEDRPKCARSLMDVLETVVSNTDMIWDLTRTMDWSVENPTEEDELAKLWTSRKATVYLSPVNDLVLAQVGKMVQPLYSDDEDDIEDESEDDGEEDSEDDIEDFSEDITEDTLSFRHSSMSANTQAQLIPQARPNVTGARWKFTQRIWRVFVPPVGPDMLKRFKISAISQISPSGPLFARMHNKRLAEGYLGEVLKQIIFGCQYKIERLLDEDIEMDAVRRQLRKFGFVYDVVDE